MVDKAPESALCDKTVTILPHAAIRSRRPSPTWNSRSGLDDRGVIDDGHITGDDVCHQVAGPWSYAEAVTAEAASENEAAYARNLADARNTVRCPVDAAGPRGSDRAILEL